VGAAAGQPQVDGASGCAASVALRRLGADLVLDVAGLAAGEDGRERAQRAVDVLLELLDLLQPVKDFAAFERGKMFVALCVRRPCSERGAGTSLSAPAAACGVLSPNLARTFHGRQGGEGGRRLLAGPPHW